MVASLEGMRVVSSSECFMLHKARSGFHCNTQSVIVCLRLDLHYMQRRPVTTRVLQVYSLLADCMTLAGMLQRYTHARISADLTMPNDVHSLAFLGLDSPKIHSLHDQGQGQTSSKTAFLLCIRAR